MASKKGIKKISNGKGKRRKITKEKNAGSARRAGSDRVGGWNIRKGRNGGKKNKKGSNGGKKIRGSSNGGGRSIGIFIIAHIFVVTSFFVIDGFFGFLTSFFFGFW